jgi:hypothetical protein
MTSLYPQKLALTLPTSRGCSLSIVRLQTTATELLCPSYIVFAVSVITYDFAVIDFKFLSDTLACYMGRSVHILTLVIKKTCQVAPLLPRNFFVFEKYTMWQL